MTDPGATVAEALPAAPRGIRDALEELLPVRRYEQSRPERDRRPAEVSEELLERAEAKRARRARRRLEVLR